MPELPYVLSVKLEKKWINSRKLSRFDGFKAGKPSAKLDLGNVGGRGAGAGTLFCLDAHADPPVLWVRAETRRSRTQWGPGASTCPAPALPSSLPRCARSARRCPAARHLLGRSP